MAGLVTTLLPALVVLLLLASLLVAVWSRGMFAAKSRVDAATAAAEGVLALLVAREFLPWSQLPVVLWTVPVLAFAAGAVGLVLRWNDLPGSRPGRSLIATVAGTGLTAVLVVLVAALIVG